ncbi:MAG: peroxide stress protein YaaA [Lachnospiraceae bacterium]
MRIILSPAKKMNVTDILAPLGVPVFLMQTAEILAWLQGKTYEELKTLWGCNDKIAAQNMERLQDMKLAAEQLVTAGSLPTAASKPGISAANLTPAILSYEGIAYQYMAPSVFEEEQLAYVQEHLRILSAFYGVLKPMDGVTPYRLEMQAKATIAGHKDLYDLWGDRLYREVRDDSGVIINLASKEYSKCIEKYLTDRDTYITCEFVEEVKGKMVTKGTYAKMARGEMVRYMAEYAIEDPVELKRFDRLGYVFREDLSTEGKQAVYVFERQTG